MRSFLRASAMLRGLALQFVALACASWLGNVRKVAAEVVDFTTFTTESFPHADNNGDPLTDAFPLANWSSTASTATHNGGASPSIFFSPWSMSGKRITGNLNPGVDRDLVGFVFGFVPGSATLGHPNTVGADYLLLDWKRTSQAFNYSDFANEGFVAFNNLTPGVLSETGLALSRVTGIPTGDELWGHADLAENSQGGLSSIGRAASLGSVGYTISTPYAFDIRYTATLLVVYVDGVQQFNRFGTFPEGRLGLYTNLQGTATNAAIFSDFNVFDIPAGDFDLSGATDGSDFLVWQRELGAIGASAADADANGEVDGDDLDVWKGSLSPGPMLTAHSVNVPEPAFGTYVVCLLWVFRRKTLRQQYSWPSLPS